LLRNIFLLKYAAYVGTAYIAAKEFNARDDVMTAEKKNLKRWACSLISETENDGFVDIPHSKQTNKKTPKTKQRKKICPQTNRGGNLDFCTLLLRFVLVLACITCFSEVQRSCWFVSL